MQGTPVLVEGEKGPVAVWQTAENAETRIRELGTAGIALSVESNAELPAGVYSNDRLFVAYIAKEKQTRTIWLLQRRE